MTKVSSLTELLGAGVDQANDLLEIVDMSEAGAARNKKIKIAQLLGLVTDIVGLLDFKGTTDCSANPNYPAASKGDFYLVSVAGKIGGASGIDVTAGDSYFATADNVGGTQAGVGTSWTVIQGNINFTPVNIAGDTMTGDLNVPDEAYDATNWNGSLEVPTKNAVRDKFESLSIGGAITAKDEGSNLTTALASIDFVGAGVVATNSGGDVTVTIAGGSGYTSENARDDIGAALVEGAGIDITVNDGADTITIAALTYEAGPPTPPVSGSYSWDNQGTSTVTDGTKALILKPQVDGILHGMVAAAPATPWNLYCRVKMDCLSTAVNTTQISQAAGVVLKDTGGDNERLLLGIYVERIAGDENINYGAIIQRWTGASPPVFSATPVLKLGNRPWDWIRVANDGTTITLYVSYNGVDWITAGTETLAAFIDGAASAGFGATASANATEAAAFFSYFSFTAPA